MGLLKDIFDKEKGVLTKAEKRLNAAEKDREDRGEKQASDAFEKVLSYLDRNHEVFDQRKGDFSRVYTRLGGRLETVGHVKSASHAYDRALELDPENFDALNGKGAFLLENGMAEGAIDLFDRALKITPTHVITRFNRARTLKELQRTDEAESTLRELVKDEAKNLEYLDSLVDLVGPEPSLMRQKAVLHRERGEVDEAVEALEAAILADPADRELWIYRADLESDRGDDEAQAEALEKAIAAGDVGPDPLLLRRLGRTYMRMDDHGKALHSFDRGLDIADDEPGLLQGRAEALYGLERLADADEAYAKALKVLGEDADKEVILGASKLKTEQGHHLDAASLLERAHSLDPDDPTILKARSGALAATGDYVGALGDLEKALQLEVNDLDGWIRIVEILKHLDDDAHLARCARRVVELDPDRRDMWLVLGDALSRLERPEEAVEAYDSALAIRRDDPVTMAKRLEVIVAKGDWEAAIETADELINLEPEHTRAMAIKGEGLERMGQHKEAVAATDHLLKVDRKDMGAHMRKARSLKALGNLDGSAAALRAALEVDRGHSDARHLLSHVLLEAEHYKESLEVLDQLVGERGDDASVWIAKGKAHLELRSPDLAKRAFSRALELDTGNAEVLALLGRTLGEIGDHAEALKVLERAMELSPDDPDVHALAGKAMVAQGKYTLAEQAFTRALKLRPKDLDVMLFRKEALVALDKHEDIIKAADAVLDMDPRDVRTLVEQGEAYMALGRPPQALKSFQRAADLEPGNPGIHELIASCQKALDHKDDLAKTLDRVIELDARNKTAWTDRGMLLKEASRNEEALRCFEEVVSLDPKDSAAHNNRGVVLAALGRYEDAAEAYTKALEHDARDAGAMRNLGVAYTHLDKYIEAVGAFDQALEVEPKDAGTWNNKGLALSKLGKLREALDCFDRGIGLDPDDPAIRNNKGTVLARLDRMQDAVESYEKAVELNPEDKSAWFNLGICYDRIKEFEKAVDALHKSTDLDPDDKAAWHNLGLILTRSKKFQEAVEAFDKTVVLNPRDPAVWNNRGIALDHLGRWEEAINSYVKALEIEPLDKVAWYNKAVAYFQLERYEEALDAFNTALEIDPDYHAASEKRQETLEFLKHRNVEKHARSILTFEHKHRRPPSKEEIFRECQVPFEAIDETLGYIAKKETIRLEDLSPKELADYENATATVIKFSLRHKPHTNDVSISISELLFNFPDTSIPRAKRILSYLKKVDKLKILPPQPLPPELEKAVRMALDLPRGERTIADISRKLGAGILTARKIKAVLDHLEEETDVGDQEIAIESLKKPRAKAARRATPIDDITAADVDFAEMRPRAEPRAETKKEPLVCAVCKDNPPSIRHFECGQLICDDCIRKANATRSMSKHQPTVCPICRMPIIEGSTDDLL